MILYVNNTGANVSDFHALIVQAIEADGVFGEDLADIFSLSKTPEGSAVAWALNWK